MNTLTALLYLCLSVWNLVPTFHAHKYQPVYSASEEGIICLPHRICVTCWEQEHCKTMYMSVRGGVWVNVCQCGKEVKP